MLHHTDACAYYDMRTMGASMCVCMTRERIKTKHPKMAVLLAKLLPASLYSHSKQFPVIVNTQHEQTLYLSTMLRTIVSIVPEALVYSIYTHHATSYIYSDKITMSTLSLCHYTGPKQ